MDEALAAQTSIALYPPNSGFSYTRFSFFFLRSMGLRWRSWVHSVSR